MVTAMEANTIIEMMWILISSHQDTTRFSRDFFCRNNKEEYLVRTESKIRGYHFGRKTKLALLYVFALDFKRQVFFQAEWCVCFHVNVCFRSPACRFLTRERYKLCCPKTPRHRDVALHFYEDSRQCEATPLCLLA